MPKDGGNQTRGPLTDAEKTLIVELAEQDVPRNEIARRTGRSAGVVTKVCKAAGISFDRTTTKQATEARSADLRSMRTMLEEETLRKFGFILMQVDQQHVIRSFSAQLGEYFEKPVAVAPPRELADYARAVKDLAAAAKALAEANAATQDTQADTSGLFEWLEAEVDGGEAA